MTFTWSDELAYYIIIFTMFLPLRLEHVLSSLCPGTCPLDEIDARGPLLLSSVI